MRFRVDVAALTPQMEWPDVHGAARGVIYDLVRGQDSALATELHDIGWNGTPLRPLGLCPPVFPGAPRKKGTYATSNRGMLRLGSPVPRIAACLLAGLGGANELRWGRTPLRVNGVQMEAPPEHSSGVAVFETVSPVVLKHDDRFLLPEDTGYEERLAHNIRHKADALGVASETEVEVLKAGHRRMFRAGKGLRIGAPLTVRVHASPALLDALYDWGLGLANNQGFGWVK
ncbi:CRISPR-associated endoribonuclease Cas6 [Thermobifida halotolerans]|uniref:CRISPR-associated endoribonuclease Cas6 n=1 Tax=Thermobifida halotolerans TaxID=483545 RepID=A0A399FW31_9ACTN|nr:CRISPR-associated endoribonuclease Cas6 [Thermobifida halotolerans]UOE21972.1 CRISPR-associated endoribonuclease Cas6 [Thermobifida halotolerans]